jgi:hypothetical protein
MHTLGQDAVAVQAQADKHYSGHHTHTVGINRVHIRSVAMGGLVSYTEDIVK